MTVKKVRNVAGSHRAKLLAWRATATRTFSSSCFCVIAVAAAGVWKAREPAVYRADPGRPESSGPRSFSNSAGVPTKNSIRLTPLSP